MQGWETLTMILSIGDMPVSTEQPDGSAAPQSHRTRRPKNWVI